LHPGDRRDVPVRRLLTVAALAAIVALTASCSPQTAGAMKGHLTLITEFSDAQHLVAGHSVRIGDVQVGSVTKVALDGYRARVTMSIAHGHRIPVGTVPQLALSSLLGENFIQLNLPPHFDPVHGPFLKSGTVLTNGSSQAQLEDIAQQAITLFSAVSGGDLSTIVNSMAQAVNGRGRELRQVIAEFAQVSDVYANQNRRHPAGRRLLSGPHSASSGRTLEGQSGDVDRRLLEQPHPQWRHARCHFPRTDDSERSGHDGGAFAQGVTGQSAGSSEPFHCCCARNR
jgi:hypothetical protein